MGHGGGDPGFPPPGGESVSPAEIVGRLALYERVLLEVRDSLYDGSWERVLEDLRARQGGKPYLFKLSRKIERDVAAIERMQAYEREHGVDLGRLLREHAQA